MCGSALAQNNGADVEAIIEATKNFKPKTFITEYSIPDSTTKILIQRTQSHPFLSEHTRHVALEIAGQLVAKEILYPDSGGGMIANLYRLADKRYVLIDANGYWFTFDVPGKQIQVSEWQFAKKTPTEYLGVFSYDLKDEYRFIPAKERAEESPYKQKDPDRYGAQQDGADQPATAPESKAESGQKSKQESKGRSQ
jgi:hypothetical protein